MSWNQSNPAIKRLMKEVQSLESNPSPNFVAYPTDDNIFQWHFTLSGPPDTPYAHGLYHGKILLPANYPFAPPDVILLTPNGRFELNKKICVSITSYHPENWNPTFNIAMVLSALREFMSTPGNNAIGAIEYSEDVRKKMALESLAYVCPQCRQSNAEHHFRMSAVPADSQTKNSVELTPVSVALPPSTTPVLPPIGPLPAAAAEPAAAPDRVDQAAAPVVNAAAVPPAAGRGPEPHHAIVVNVQTLDNIIGIVFFAILLILVKKYLSGNISDVMNFPL